MMPSRKAGGTRDKLCFLSAFSSFFLAALTAAWPLAADGLNISERERGRGKKDALLLAQMLSLSCSEGRIPGKISENEGFSTQMLLKFNACSS
jgi:hypothetical protein